LVVDVTGTGDRPGIGWRLRRLTVRLMIGAGLATLAWLLSAALDASTASAGEPTSAPANGQTSGVVLGTVLGDTTTGLTNTLATVTGGVGSTVGSAVGTTVVPPAKPAPMPTNTAPPRATPLRATPVVVRHTSAPRALPAARQAVVVDQQGRAAHAVTPAKTTPGKPHRRPFLERPVSAPAPVPAPAPQAPRPDVPATVASAGHTTGYLARYVIAERIPHLSAPTLVAKGGWSADPATVAARCQCMPATSPD
jgi:hypothetical protein